MTSATVTLEGNAPFTVDSDASYGDDAFCQLSLANTGSNSVRLSGCFLQKRPVNLAFAVNDPARVCQ